MVGRPLMVAIAILCMWNVAAVVARQNNVIELDAKNFDQVMEGIGKHPIMVAFTAPWCT